MTEKERIMAALFWMLSKLFLEITYLLYQNVVFIRQDIQWMRRNKGLEYARPIY